MDAETLFFREYDKQEKNVWAVSSNIAYKYDDVNLIIETLKRMDVKLVNALEKSG